MDKFHLVVIHIKVTLYHIVEGIRSLFRYPSFFFTDLLLQSSYLYKSPYKICKKAALVYGETPLSTCDKIARECRLLSKEVIFDLGCGTGRLLFWFSHYVRCETFGIDMMEPLIKRGEWVKKWTKSNRVHFLHQEITETNLEKATTIYLYGTTLPDATIHTLISKFETLKRGTKIITVSFPLSEYTPSPLFTLKKTFPARFPWGKANVFYQVKL